MNCKTAFHEGTCSHPASRLWSRDKLKRPLKDLRISVIDRCNLQCPYCMPGENFSQQYTFLDQKEWLSFEEITRLTRLFAALGVRKVRITGGEPLLRNNLAELIRSLHGIREINDLAMTTNGILLAKHAYALKKAGLKRLTVSLDTLDREIFWKMNGKKAHCEKVLEGIKEAQAAGFTPIKINAVVLKGINDHTLVDLIEYFSNSSFIVRFIEYMDVGSKNHWNPSLVVPSKSILGTIRKKFTLRPIEPNYCGEVAKRYTVLETGGEIGLIASISEPFCGTCTRARLSADGNLYTCLFGADSTDLRKLLRKGLNDTELLEIINNTWQGREDRYSELRFSGESNQTGRKKVEMYQIGG